MCNNTKNNPTRNPIRIAALTHLTEMLETMGKSKNFGTQQERDEILSLAVFAVKIGAINAAEGKAISHEFMNLHCLRTTNEWASCEPTRCEDCDAVVPYSMIHDLVAPNDGGGIALCETCHQHGCDPRSRHNEFVERGWDGCGDFEDTPSFQRDLPVELD